MRILTALALMACTAVAADAHHSYSMFNGGRTLQVTGTIAKLEWRNPHVYVWMYVRDAKAPNGHTLYGFENGSTNVLANRGWSGKTLTAGETVTVTYFPLKDGRPGGHFISATFADGRVVRGMGGPLGGDRKSSK